MTPLDPVLVLAMALVALSAVPPLAFFVVYPALLSTLPSRRDAEPAEDRDDLPSVSFILAARNAEQLIAEKISNCFAADYPAELLEVVLVSDGSTDGTVSAAESLAESRLQTLALKSHMGKIVALNEAVKRARGEILVFTDADARLPADALQRLIRHFRQPDVGGVCGRRVIAQEQNRFEQAQSDYMQIDTWIKRMESRIHSISSSDGKLAAVRRELFSPIPEAVTDDTYVCMNVVRQQRRFLFDPEAIAFIRTPSLDRSHEFVRRRRIVAQALNGIFLMKQVLNPFRFGFFSIAVICNKIMRRMMALSFPLLLLGTFLLGLQSRLAMLAFALQLAFYIVAIAEPLIPGTRALGALSRPAAAAHYFVLGLLGTFFGILDFALGRKAHKWETVSSA